ncbi:methyltransferase N6AMT1-like isoform X2 [Dermacentor silvarum]|uniref:methyltransferase N6AMT1-like isoform X2 n=1 Tax=Dermacentor silvarum TaxID=543639 RepID=UPI002100D5F8|nr:methyltransferase N6AMT1-like isoform X2 [Dermacentor silvarum]
METPIVSCFSESEAASVYEPAEDSFLLIDALEKELPEITRRRATDINEKAAAMTKRTCIRNEADVDVVVSDLVGCLADRLQKKVDLLVFNPPYVVTPTKEVQGNQLLTRSWAGGIKGREVMDRLAPYVSQILSDRGLYFLLLIKENDPDDVCKLMSTHGLQGKCVIARRCGAEHLSVWQFEKCMNKS